MHKSAAEPLLKVPAQGAQVPSLPGHTGEYAPFLETAALAIDSAK